MEIFSFIELDCDKFAENLGLKIYCNLFIPHLNNLNLETMATIQLSPAGTPINPPVGQTVEQWFKSNSHDQNFVNFETENSIEFSAAHLNQLIQNPSPVKPQMLVFSKIEHSNKKTLAVGGVNGDHSLQAEGNSMFFVGSSSDSPNSTTHFNLDFSGILTDPRHRGHWGAPDTITNPTGSFKTQMENFQKTPFQANLFRTVKFEDAIIKDLIDVNNTDKIVFLPGFIYFTTEVQLESGPFILPINSSMPIEILLAFAVDASNNVLAPPAMPLGPWPLRWP